MRARRTPCTSGGLWAVHICEALAVLALSRNTTELARRVGMSRMGLRKAMEPGANPGFTTIARVADALGLRLELLAA